MPIFCWAQEPVATPSPAPATMPQPAPEAAPVAVEKPSSIERKKNYFGIGLSAVQAIGYGAGIHFSYGFRVSERFILGGAVGANGTGSDAHGGGLSSKGQYYKHHTGYSSGTVEVSATYFFQEQGYKKFGFLLRGGLGQETVTLDGYYKRYDDDPAFIQIGDGLRLKETGPRHASKFIRNFVRIEPAYQFTWPRRFESKVGANTLEIALSFLCADRTGSLSYIRTDGTAVNEEAPMIVSALKVSYIITL